MAWYYHRYANESVSSQIASGTTGIFMPIKYDETSIREENGKTLALLDLTEYGFPDGERWMFIETANGLVYNKHAYPSFATAKDLKHKPLYTLNIVFEFSVNRPPVDDEF